jgi:hypothetical protein
MKASVWDAIKIYVGSDEKLASSSPTGRQKIAGRLICDSGHGRTFLQTESLRSDKTTLLWLRA